MTSSRVAPNLRELLLDQAEGCDGAAKLLPLIGVGGGLSDQLAHACRSGAPQAEAAVVQDLHRYLEPTAHLAQHLQRGSKCERGRGDSSSGGGSRVHRRQPRT